MHEGMLINDLVRKITSIAREQQATRVIAATVRVGDYSHVSSDHLREHFELAARGTLAQDARLDVIAVGGTDDPTALELVLDSIEIET
jgi:hydrogenase nickel incorporation protein HypA/HybF